MKRISFIAPELRRLENTGGNLIALYCFEEKRPFRGITSLIDWRLYSHLSRMVIEGFFLGSAGEQLLMPLGRHLPQENLLLVGLGKRALFGEASFSDTVALTFETMRKLDAVDLILSLPGRQEGVCQSSDAIEWFIDNYDKWGDEKEIVIIEPQGAQKAMLPSVERWRLRQLVP